MQAISIIGLFGLVILASLLVAPRRATIGGFFNGATLEGRAPDLWVLVLSQVTTWIFARSLMNSAILGYFYGIWGTLAYAAYYGSFLTGGYIVGRLRAGGAGSVQDWLGARFGLAGNACYNAVIGLRLLSEVFANLLVVGLIFAAILPGMGVAREAAILIVAALGLAYSAWGGLSAALRTDVLQMVVFLAVFTAAFIALIVSPGFQIGAVLTAPGTAGAWNGQVLLLVALLQVFSYPAHDPVMMDRGFLADPDTTRKSFLHAFWISTLCIMGFGFFGIQAGLVGAEYEGELIGTPRQTRIASFWMEGPSAAFQSWASLAEKLKRAEETFETTGSQETLKTVINTDWGRPYLHRRSEVQRSSQQLMDRAEQTERRTVPHGVRFLTATVDVQGGKHRRFVVQIHGWGVQREKWIIDRFNIKEDRGPDNDQPPRQISPATQPEDWDLLTRDVLKRSYRLADGRGRRMPILAVAVDTGGEKGDDGESVTSQAYDWFRRLRKDGLQSRAYLVKGGSSRTANRVTKSWPDNTGRKSRKSRARGDVPLYILGTDLLKDAVAAMMDRDNPGAGYMHVPSWLGRWWYDELTYEVRDPATGKWSRPGKRPNEAFDLLAYDSALGIILGIEKIDWAAPPPWATDWDENILVFDPEAGQRPAEPAYKHEQAPPKKRRRKVAKPRI